MNPASSQWNTSRWRDSSSNHAAPSMDSSHIDLTSSWASHYPSRPPPPQVSAPTAINLSAPPSSTLAPQQRNDVWIRKSCEEGPLPTLTTDTEPYFAVSGRTLSSSHRCESPNDARRNSLHHYAGHQITDPSPPRHTPAGTWQLHYADRRSSLSHPPDAPPLTLQIPRPQDPSRISPTASHFHDLQSYDKSKSSQSILTPSTLLPSFASLQEHTSRSEDGDGPEIASMSSRLSCYHCTKFKPLVQDITTAVAELEETVQALCGTSIASAGNADGLSDSPIRAAQWILERLHYAKHHIREATKRNQGGYPNHAQQNQPPDVFSNSPHNPLKRPAEPGERDDIHSLKRPRSGASGDQSIRLPSLATHDPRQEPPAFGHRELRQGFSPAPSESVPGSAYPKQTSPTLTTRFNTRALPSPSSLVYPPSAAPSLPPPSGPSVGSPATSYQQAPSVHSASTNSATSAHIADLQHQITLKSLALQTLQTEYSSLLQKLQRERVKSQAIEKKTTVADQEVNELTTKNEELTEQVKTLETQLDESESKRETERAEAAREKDQWGRMLEMGGRLQAKIDGDRQKLLEEKTGLLQRINRLEALQGSSSSALDSILPGQNPDQASYSDSSHRTVHVESTTGKNENGTDEVAGLRQEVTSLNGRINALRLALEGAKRQHSDMQEQTRRLLENGASCASNIDRAISDDDINARQSTKSALTTASSRSTPARLEPAWAPPAPSAPSGVPPSSRTTAPPGPHAGTLEVYSDGKVRTASIAEVARARSPGPEELGIQVTPSTSSPEELIRALGPVPAPIPSLQFAARSHPDDSTKERRAIAAPGNRQVFDFRASRIDQDRPPNSSPRSFHSSPGELVEDRSSNASSANRSPDAYASDPERRDIAGTKSAGAIGRFTPLNLETTKSQESSGHYTWVPAMPPPPRPDPASSFPQS